MATWVQWLIGVALACNMWFWLGMAIGYDLCYMRSPTQPFCAPVLLKHK